MLIFLGWAAGLLGFVYALGMMESYELLVHNDQYASRTLFRSGADSRGKSYNPQMYMKAPRGAAAWGRCSFFGQKASFCWL